MRGVAIPDRRIVSPNVAGRQAPALRHPAGERPQAEPELSTRPATAADLPWLQSWAAHLGLPAPRSRRIRSFILLKQSQRVGYLAIREDTIETSGVREPILWIVSAFLVPSMRGRRLILEFGEMLSRHYYRKGKVGCRVAADNARMLKLMARGGWKKVHATRRHVDFVLELDGPFRAPWR